MYPVLPPKFDVIVPLNDWPSEEIVKTTLLDIP
jgi:hypothetical protein